MNYFIYYCFSYFVPDVTDINGIVVPTAACVSIFVSWILPRLNEKNKETSVNNASCLGDIVSVTQNSMLNLHNFSSLHPDLSENRIMLVHTPTPESREVDNRPEGSLHSSRCSPCEETHYTRNAGFLSSRPASEGSAALWLQSGENREHDCHCMGNPPRHGQSTGLYMLKFLPLWPQCPLRQYGHHVYKNL